MTDRPDIAVPARLRTPTGAVVNAVLGYRAMDPYAVELAMDSGAETVVWIFARDLLRDALSGGAGVGDVHLHPAGPTELLLQLHPGRGEPAIFHVDTATVSRFVDAAYTLTPDGAETALLGLDTALDQLLAAEGDAAP